MPGRATIAYQPALDGVRALAVVAVLLFHGEVVGFDGGYLGVSVFFTLSGFLITSLLLREHDGSGRVDLPAFYGRRLRRLMPASVVCIAAIVLVAGLTDVFDRVTALRAHVLGSLLQVANWVFLAGEGSYQDLLARDSGTASPLEHFWSLAIEEQFYWVWPPVMFLVLRRVPRWRGRLFVIGSITVIFMVAAPVIALVWGPDAAYWATPARVGEILVGAVIAVVVAMRGVDERWRVFAGPALAVLAIAVVTFPTSGGPAYNGALPLVALVSGALVLGLQAEGSVRRALSWTPLVDLGRISYGVYLFHWPIYVVLDAERTGLDGPALLLMRLALTLVVSVVSYRLLERPIRLGRIALRPTFTTSAVVTVSVAVFAIAVVPPSVTDYWNAPDDLVEAAAIDVDDAVAPLALAADDPMPTSVPDVGQPPPSTFTPSTTVPASGSTFTSSTIVATDDPTATTDPSSDPVPELTRPVRVLVSGDSTAGAVGTGIVAWAAEHPDIAQAEIVHALGCGFLEGGERRIGDEIREPEGCETWVDDFVLPAVERTRPDVVMLMVTSWDVIDRRWDTEDLLDPGDPDYRARLDHDYEAIVEDVLAAGAGSVALVAHPIPDPFWLDQGHGQSDPARHAIIYDVHRQTAESFGRAETVAFAEWFTERGFDADQEVRPDGIHVTPDAAAMIASEFLGWELVSIALGGTPT